MKEAKEKLRIDKYLWAIRIFKKRSLAADACDNNKIKMQDKNIKASKAVNVGEEYEIKTDERKWIIKVTGLLFNRVQYSEAIKYYIDITPPDEIENLKSEASSFHTGKRMSKIGRPTKKQRRDLGDFMED